MIASLLWLRSGSSDADRGTLTASAAIGAKGGGLLRYSLLQPLTKETETLGRVRR